MNGLEVEMSSNVPTLTMRPGNAIWWSSQREKKMLHNCIYIGQWGLISRRKTGEAAQSGAPLEAEGAVFRTAKPTLICESSSITCRSLVIINIPTLGRDTPAGKIPPHGPGRGIQHRQSQDE